MKRNTYNPVFRKRLEAALIRNDLSCGELSVKAGISRTVIYNYMTLGTMPSCMNIVKLCKTLNVSADYLLGLKGAEYDS